MPKLQLTTVVAVVGAAGGAGCSGRVIIARPEHTPSSSAWITVWLAAAIVVLLAGLLLTLPAWRARVGARLATIVLTVQTGAIAVGGALLTGAAIRSWQLVDHPRPRPGAALVRLSGIDGDAGFFVIMALVVGLLTILVTSLSASTTRLASSVDPVQRSTAAGLLTLELGGAAYFLTRMVLGARGLLYWGGALAFPVLLLAAITCWPRRATT